MDPKIVTDITYADLLALVGNLEEGLQYNITDRGIRLTAISKTQFNPDGLRTMLCPANYTIETDAYGNKWIGVWNANRISSVNDLTIWGGLVWKNLTGIVGTKVDDFSLDVVNWVAIPKATFTNHEYISLIFNVNYDIINDWINRQWDGKGNIFGLSKSDFILWYSIEGEPQNLIDICDWNCSTVDTLFFNNKCNYSYNNNCSVWNNINMGEISDNICLVGIYNNTNTDDISRNICDSIENNSNTGAIENNNCNNIASNNNSGVIENNSNTGNISYNRNSKDISDNSIIGSISGNANNGRIVNNSNVSTTCDILNNNNNGDITGVWDTNVIDNTVTKTGVATTTTTTTTV